MAPERTARRPVAEGSARAAGADTRSQPPTADPGQPARPTGDCVRDGITRDGSSGVPTGESGVRGRVAHITPPPPAFPAPEGYSVGSWRCSPVRTTCVPLDHGGPTVVPGGGVRVSASGARHDMRDVVPPCEMCYRGEAGTGRRNRPRRRPGRPRHPTRRSHRAQRTRRRPEQTVTNDLHAPRLQNHP